MGAEHGLPDGAADGVFVDDGTGGGADGGSLERSYTELQREGTEIGNRRLLREIEEGLGGCKLVIVIEITNVDELVKRKKGRIASIIGPLITDVEAEVEKAVIEQIKEAFGSEGVEAKIASVRGLRLDDFVFETDTEGEAAGGEDVEEEG